MRTFVAAFLFVCVLLLCISVGLFLYIRFTPPFLVSPVVETLGFSKPDVVGFQPYWLVYEGKDSYSSDITTLSYFSLRLEKDGTIRKFDAPGEGEPGWVMLQSDTYAASLSAQKKSGTKLSLVVQNMVEDEILELIAQPEETGATLVSEVAPVMIEHGFTDLNLDIESFNTASDAARMQYVQFVKTVKDELTRRHLGTLTVELTPKSPVEMHLIDIARIGEIADTLILMAYDYHYIYSSVAGPIAPISGVPTVAEYDVETALQETLRYAPKEKVLLGIPLYGYEWETVDKTPGSPVIPGSWQLATAKRMDELLKTCTDCVSGFDQNSKEPYVIYNGETEGHVQQSFYENKDAVKAKIDLVNKYQLAGVAMWALGYETDDMLAPIRMYKNSVQYHGFSMQPVVPYTKIQPASRTLLPPTHAYVGSIATMSGTMKKLGRQDESYQDIATPSAIVQGDSIASEANGTANIRIQNVATITMGSWAEIAFSDLLPPGMLVRQKNGTVSYTRESVDIPWSVRVLRSLLVLDSGEVQVQIDGSRATIYQKSGSSRIGAIDTLNETTVYTLKEGQSALINDSLQTIRIR